MKRFSLVILVTVLAVSCRSKKEEISVNYLDLQEKGLPCKVTCSTLSEDTARILTTELVNKEKFVKKNQ